ncbi:hypothetical protein [uncultured phage MedDCM-OCT-S04-C507]|nr:hypothetical protein [uncultured phage MedDCM-OCT-S04-C507]
MAKKRGIGQIITDLEKKINSDYNALIQLTVEGLSTEENSPVDTGFFASSWKASVQKIRANDKREDHAPWSKIYETRQPGGRTTWSSIGNQWVHTDKKPIGNQIKPRFTVPEFNYKRQPTVYIGNTAEYAGYALESPKVSNFIQGEMRSLVQETFGDKRPGRIFARTGSSSSVFGSYLKL